VSTQAARLVLNSIDRSRTSAASRFFFDADLPLEKPGCCFFAASTTPLTTLRALLEGRLPAHTQCTRHHEKRAPTHPRSAWRVRAPCEPGALAGSESLELLLRVRRLLDRADRVFVRLLGQLAQRRRRTRRTAEEQQQRAQLRRRRRRAPGRAATARWRRGGVADPLAGLLFAGLLLNGGSAPPAALAASALAAAAAAASTAAAAAAASASRAYECTMCGRTSVDGTSVASYAPKCASPSASRALASCTSETPRGWRQLRPVTS
jgi:hypothetical protein